MRQGTKLAEELPRTPYTGSSRFPRTLLLGSSVNKGHEQGPGATTPRPLFCYPLARLTRI
jgi:hypothetical protein